MSCALAADRIVEIAEEVPVEAVLSSTRTVDIASSTLVMRANLCKRNGERGGSAKWRKRTARTPRVGGGEAFPSAEDPSLQHSWSPAVTEAHAASCHARGKGPTRAVGSTQRVIGFAGHALRLICSPDPKWQHFSAN